MHVRIALRLAVATAIALVLSACSGGGVPVASSPPGGAAGTYPLATPTGSVGGETPPHVFSPWDISVIHLETTDMHRRLLMSGDAVFGGQTVPVAVGDIVRAKMVCPGLRHNGNTCSTDEVEVNGQTYSEKTQVVGVGAPPGDFSIRVQQDILQQKFSTLSSSSLPGVTAFRGDYRDVNGFGEVWGGHGNYSAFYVVHLPGFTGIMDSWGVAFGNLSPGRPVGQEGAARWSGAMVARVVRNGAAVSGASNLVYDFSDQRMDLTFSRIMGNGYSGPESFGWSGLPLNSDASFYMPGYGNDNANADPHPTLGYVDGDLYGPNAEEFAGVFERYGMVGAFGGKRTGDAQ